MLPHQHCRFPSLPGCLTGHASPISWLTLRFYAYEAAGILDKNNPESKDFDFLRYWQVRYPNNLFYSEFIQ
jgi:hypothetical protein